MTTVENARLGVRIEIRKTAEETDGELFEFDVVGRARGLLTQTHVHTVQTERHEVIEGTMRLVIEGREHVLKQGEAMTVPVGAKHRQLAGPGHDGPGRVRVQLRPAADGEAFVRRLADLDVNRWGFPRPLAAAQLVRDFGHTGHAAQPPLRVQRALSRAILGATSREYVFVDEWDVAAPREPVFAALADARTYPEWWKPVYIEVDAEGEPALGKESRQHFKGRLPYHLHTRSRIVALEAPHVIEGEVDGDLRGHGRWTLTDTPGGGTHVRFDWRVHADRRLLRILTPVLRPALRWNHAWAIARAVEGLEPYARRRAATS
jgi:uncharacterized protein YndB with AHSA1/START domain/mannose-6-phosphate isomerase-like protein (cupin superfamily)